MKRIITVLCFLMIGIAVQAQSNTFRMRSFSMNFSYYDESIKDFGPWDASTDANVLIVITKNTVDVYSKEDHKFSIITMSESTETEDGSYFTLSCVDENNTRCSLLFYYKSKINVHQLVITYSNMKICYNCNQE